MINPMDLTGKRILVTGASSGVGRQVCITLSQLGANVVMIARREEALKNTLTQMEDGEHKYYAFDLNEIENISGLIKQIVSEEGKLDGFVHCAGLGTMKPLKATTYQFMKEMYDVNVFSFVEICRNYAMKKNNNGGSIVVISSAASVRGDKAKLAYCSSKGALDSAVQALAAELGSKNIRVNSVHPGWINTDMYKDYVAATGEQVVAEIEERQIMGVAEPEDIALPIAFLLSDASKQMTGTPVLVDGGRLIW